MEYQGKVPFVYIDSNNADTQSLSAKYEVLYVPTLVFIDKNGKVANKLVGNINEDSLKENTKKILK